MKSEKMEQKLRNLYRDKDVKKLKELLSEKLYKLSPTMEHVRDLILDLKMFMRILIDQDFDLKEEARRDFVGVIRGFLEKKRVFPIIGYWDIYKLSRYVKNKHREEIDRYFSQVRHFIANYF